MQAAVACLLVVVLAASGCSRSDDDGEPVTSFVPATSIADIADTADASIVRDRASLTGLGDPADVDLDDVDDLAAVERYLDDHSVLVELHAVLGEFIGEQVVTELSCVGVAGELEPLGSPTELQATAGGIPDAVGAELYVGLVQAAGDVLAQCAIDDTADAFTSSLAEMSWQWLMTEEWNRML